MWPVSRRVSKTGTGDDDPTLLHEVVDNANQARFADDDNNVSQKVINRTRGENIQY
jgi:hypothetical protein